MNEENFKLLVRNLRKGNHAKLKIQSTASSVKFNKVRKCIQLQQPAEFDNGSGQ